jgi:hypothetical protein
MGLTAACGTTGLGADGSVKKSRGWATGGGGVAAFDGADATFGPGGRERLAFG